MRAFASNVRLVTVTLATSMLASIAGPSRAQPTNPAATLPVTYADQGWSAADRDIFYTTSQGSRLMPYAWFKALRRMDGQPFANDQLQRFGYLPNARSRSNPEGLPVGFVLDGTATSGMLGMTCAACHTAQLEYQKDGERRALRLDGAPAHADFQSFLIELTITSRATLAEADRFASFAKDVLGTGHSTARAAQLKVALGAWVEQFGEFMDSSLPKAPWGPGRLDAFGMIFNRVAARDLGIKGNFKTADAPVSYPFLWNASRQDRTQWNGGVPNGLFIHALGRNTGEVYGVFANFKPKVVARIPSRPPVISYSDNSAKFSGLQTLEEKIAALKPPPWPRDIFPVDDQRAERGKALFATHCAECHAERPSTEVLGAWATPVRAVRTDPKMIENAERMSDSGLLAGAAMPPPPLDATLANPAKTHDILANAVVGSLVDEAFDFPLTPRKIAQSGVWRAIRKDLANLFPDEKLDDIATAQPSARSVVRIQAFAKARLKAKVLERLNNMFRKPATADPGVAYESRVLYGIWATAPYLHNGSVPNLWELLKPANERKASFSVGSRMFDPKNVGYATDQTPFASGAFTADPAVGNGNGGHEYGTGLSEDQRWDLLEYLKIL